MKVFQARLKLWNIELSWFDTSAGETSINNRRSWIFRNCMLWLTCNLKKVQYTNDAVMIAQHQGWTRARKPPCISLYVLFLNWGTHDCTFKEPEQSGWCLSSLYWQLLSNKEGVVFHTLRFQRFHSRVLSVSNCYNYSAGSVLWFHYITIIMSWCSLELFIYIELRAPQTFEHQHLIKYTWSLFYVCFAFGFNFTFYILAKTWK